MPPLPRSCVCWSLLLWSFPSFAVVFMEPSCSFSLHQPFLDLALWSGTLAPVTFVACSHSFAPLRACAGRSEHVSTAASGRCSRISQSRGLVEGLVCVPPSPVRRRLLARLLRSFSTWFRRVLMSPSLHRDFFRYSFCRGILAVIASCALRCLTCRRRLTCAAQTFCHLRDAWLVLLSRRNVLLVLDLVLRPSMANSPLNSAQFVCLSRGHHSSCLFVNFLLKQLDTVGVSARPRVNVLHWQRS